MIKELIDFRRENSKTFDLGKGQRRLEAHIGAVHYKDNYEDKSEQWKDIDLTFVDGRITRAPYTLEVRDLEITVTSKKTGTVQTLALERIGSENSKLPVPWEFIGNLAVWRNAAPNTDVVIEAYPEGVNFKRILHSASAPLEAVFIYSKTVGKADDIAISVSARDADDELLEVARTDIAGKLTERLDSKVDLSKVKFPIVIDPDVTLQPPGKDTFLRENAPTTPQGGGTYVQVQTSTTNNRARTVIGFDLSGQLPAGASIISAALSLYYYYFATDPVGRTYWCYRLTRNDWTEAGATWQQYKTGSAWTTAGGDWTTTAPAGSSIIMPSAYGWVNWDAKTLVEDAIANRGNLLDLLIKDASDYISTQYLSRFYSKEYATDLTLRPKLYIEYSVFPTQYPGLRAQIAGVMQELCLVAAGDGAVGMGGIPKIAKGGIIRDIYLVETSDPDASAIRIKTTTGIKAVREKT